MPSCGVQSKGAQVLSEDVGWHSEVVVRTILGVLKHHVDVCVSAVWRHRDLKVVLEG